MGIFGELDRSVIPTAPEAGTYSWIMSNFRTFEAAKTGDTYLSVTFINDEPGAFYGYRAQKMFMLPNETTDEDVTIKKLAEVTAFFKSIGMPDDEMDDPDFAKYTGLVVLGYGKPKERKDTGETEFQIYNVRLDS